MNKKILIIPAALFVCAGLASCNKGADTEGHLVTYNVTGGVCVSSLSNANREQITNITVPNTIGGKPVVEISKGAFKACSNLKSISLPFIGHKPNADGIGGMFGYVFGDEMYDGGGAFTWQCYGLGNRYDDGVTDYHEFAIPSSLHNVTITGGDYISAGAFSKCKTLREITITDENNATEIGNYAFYDCTSLKSFKIPDKIKTIGRKAFQRCYNLQEITIPEGVTTIRHNAFSKCISASKATIPSTVDNMGKLVFEDFVSGLIMTPLKEDKAGWDPDWANSDASIVYDYHNDSLVMVNDAQFAICGEGSDRYFFFVQYTGTWENKEVTIPGEITVNGLTLPLKKIGPSVFLENTYLEKLVIQEGVELIGAHAFATCTNLKTVEFPTSLKEIGAYAFYDCRVLGTNTQITLPNVKKIGVGSFMGCYSEQDTYRYGLSRIDLGNSLEEIGESAFENDELLVDSIENADPETGAEIYEFIIPKNVKKIGARAFYNTFKYRPEESVATTSIKFDRDNTNAPCKIEEIGESAFELVGVSSETRSRYPQYSQTLQIDFDFADLALKTIPDRMCYLSYLGTISNFPVDSLEKVGDYAFYYSYGRAGTVIKLGKNLTTVGDHAFCNCTNVEFNFLNGNPDNDEFNIEKIDQYGFYGCNYKTNIALTIPDSVTSIGQDAFYNCNALKEINFPSGDACKITRLESAVFASCTGLGKDDTYTLTLPKTITYVGSSAFSGCSKLDAVVFDNDSDHPITTVGGSAFYNCAELTSVTFNGLGLAKCTSFGGSVYYQCYALVNPPYPANYTSVTSNVFYNCSSLTTFDISATVTTIGTYAFFKCGELTTITTATSIATINSFAFASCSKLANFTMPSSVSTIADSAFSGCTSLGKDAQHPFILPTALTLPWTGSKGMGANVFKGWTAEQTIYFKDANLTKEYSDEDPTIKTLWGWTLTRNGTAGSYYYTCADSGSSAVHFVRYVEPSI